MKSRQAVKDRNNEIRQALSAGGDPVVIMTTEELCKRYGKGMAKNMLVEYGKEQAFNRQFATEEMLMEFETPADDINGSWPVHSEYKMEELQRILAHYQQARKLLDRLGGRWGMVTEMLSERIGRAREVIAEKKQSDLETKVFGKRTAKKKKAIQFRKEMAALDEAEDAEVTVVHVDVGQDPFDSLDNEDVVEASIKANKPKARKAK